MNASIDRFFRGQVVDFTRVLDGFGWRIPPDAQPTSDELTSELTYHINCMLAACAELESELAADRERLKQVQAQFQEAIAPWFSQSWFMRRALDKPRGYPGDYVLLSAIYEGRPKSLGIGGYLDRYFLGTTLARAVPARMAALREFLLEELELRRADVSILNVACGACQEFVSGFNPTNNRLIRLTCVDSDTQALDFVETNVAPLVRAHMKIDLVRYNALRMTSARHNVRRFGRPEIIYSIGLCDYIPDEYLVPMLQGWRESVSDEGIVYVAFKDSKLYSTQEYQWLVDWYFLQRTVGDCRSLFEKAGYDMYRVEERDATGVIVNFIARCNVPTIVRVNAAEQLPQAPPSNLPAPPTSQHSAGGV